MYIDDGLFVELEIGDRRDQSTGKWEEIAQGLLSKYALNEEENKLEGQWSAEQIFLGFLIDTESLEIRIPEPKGWVPLFCLTIYFCRSVVTP